MTVMVTPANRTDRDAARDLLTQLRQGHPQLTCAWADSAYSGALVGWANDALNLTLIIVIRPTGQGFIVVPHRWVTERTLSWIMRARRNVRDYECLPAHSEAHITWAAITLMTRRLTRKRPQRSSIIRAMTCCDERACRAFLRPDLHRVDQAWGLPRGSAQVTIPAPMVLSPGPTAATADQRSPFKGRH
jgi:transposase